MANNFIGYLVSIESKNTFYQGIVTLIDLNKNLIQLKNVYKNGIQYQNPLIELNNNEIDNIEIIADPDKAANMLNTKKKEPENDNLNSNSSLVEKKINHKNRSPNNHNHNHNHNQQTYKSNHSCDDVNYNQSNKSPKRNNINSNNNYNNNNNNNHYNHIESENCFNSGNSEKINDEFDFEKNLALFDKQAFYQEMSQSTGQNYQQQISTINDYGKQSSTKSYYQPLSLETLFPSLGQPNNNNSNHTTPLSINNVTNPNKNYRFDEMILDTGEPVELSKIQLPIQITKQYVTDDGLKIPCINNDLKNRLFNESYKLGYTKLRQIECIARCCTELSLQLLGGPIRFLPKNQHQKPKVLVLANNEMQGAYAICTARLLSIRNVFVYIFINDTNSVASEIDKEFVQNEIKLLNQSEAKHIKNIEEIQNLAIDLIINSIDSGNNISINSQLWYRNLVKYCSTSKTSVISIDPSPDGGAIQSKLSIVPILPQAMSRNCGRIYLCDLGFTKKVFDAVNIKYQSPFGAKFLIPLHDD